MVIVNNLIKSFNGNVAVNIPYLSVNKGEIVGLVGNNGAGKTTFFRLLLDLLKADSGNVISCGNEVVHTEVWKEYTGAFIDSGFLIDIFTPDEYFAFVGKLYKLSGEAIQNRLERFGKFMNGEILNQKKYIRNFSAGNKQKIGIIAAMLVDPQILILDEPFNFLDPSSQIEIKRLLEHLNSEQGTTILISSHNLNHITDVSTRVLLMEKGILLKDIDNSHKEAVNQLDAYFQTAEE